MNRTQNAACIPKTRDTLYSLFQLTSNSFDTFCYYIQVLLLLQSYCLQFRLLPPIDIDIIQPTRSNSLASTLQAK